MEVVDGQEEGGGEEKGKCFFSALLLFCFFGGGDGGNGGGVVVDVLFVVVVVLELGGPKGEGKKREQCCWLKQLSLSYQERLSTFYYEPQSLRSLLRSGMTARHWHGSWWVVRRKKVR